MLAKTMNGIHAVQLRIILIVTICLLLLAGAGGFWLIYGQLTTYANSVRSASAEAASSNENLATLKKLQTVLADNNANIERTKSIVADSVYYQYQDQIIKDISTYAAQSGVGIAGFTFSGDAAGTAGAATPAPAAAAAPTAAPAAATPGVAATPSPSVLKSSSVSVTLKGAVPYTNIIKFIHSIEQNLTKMQLAGVSLSKDTQTNNVTSNALTIEVYVR